jgi:hypothetical protein
VRLRGWSKVRRRTSAECWSARFLKRGWHTGFYDPAIGTSESAFS